jgi:hypothetical protein
MTEQGWRECVRKTASDPVLADLMAKLLYEQDQAKQALRELGYGCSGMPWLDVIAELRARLRAAGDYV